MTMNIPHTELANQIHADNIRAGWWSDLTTGESIIHTRNRPEMLMLIVSELSEACEGWMQRCPDDKLPDYPMFEVELADAAIRIYDLLGCETGAVNFDQRVFNAVDFWIEECNAAKVVRVQLMLLVNCISDAMEGYRKGNRERFLGGLFACLGGIWAMANTFGQHPLLHLIAEKRAYNASRADHKPENRKAEGGKLF